MTHVLSYADGQALTKVRHEAGEHGGRVVVPGAGSRGALWAMLAGGVFLIVAGCGITAAASLEVPGAVSTVAGILLFVGAAIHLALPGNEPAATFTYRGPPGYVSELAAEVFVAGDPVPTRVRWGRAEVEDVHVGFARGFDGRGQPAMELVVTPVGRDPVGLMPPQRDPRAVHVVATILRGVLDLPQGRERRAAWLRTQVARREPAAVAVPISQPVAQSPPRPGGTGPPPLPTPVVPVLGYLEPRGVAVGSMLGRADVTPQRMTLTLSHHDGFERRPVSLEFTPDRLAIGVHDAQAHAWPCDEVYAVFVDFAGHDAPGELCVCTPAGTARVVTGTRTPKLRELADLLNGALGISGSVY